MYKEPPQPSLSGLPKKCLRERCSQASSLFISVIGGIVGALLTMMMLKFPKAFHDYTEYSYCLLIVWRH